MECMYVESVGMWRIVFHDLLQVHVDGSSWFYIQCVLVDTRQTTTGERRNKEKD